jgi:hypothetical protein
MRTLARPFARHRRLLGMVALPVNGELELLA